MSQLELFVADQVDDLLGEDLELRVGDDAAASCRHCRVLSTAAGVIRYGHGPGSRTCAVFVERYGLVEVDA